MVLDKKDLPDGERKTRRLNGRSAMLRGRYVVRLVSVQDGKNCCWGGWGKGRAKQFAHHPTGTS